MELLFILIVLYFFTLHLLITRSSKQAPNKQADYIIILGAKVNEQEMSLSFLSRVQTALLFAKHHPFVKIVATGGQGHDEGQPEAHAAYDYLIKNGISKERIIIEDQSTTTYENLFYTLKIIKNRDANIIIATNDYHMFRAQMIAKQVGFSNVSCLCSKTPAHALLKSYVREYFALTKFFVMRLF